MNKEQIKNTVILTADNLRAKAEAENDIISLCEYSHLMHLSDGFEIWTDAINVALSEHKAVVIPEREKPYCTDSSVIVHSGNRIYAKGAKILQIPGVRVLMLRNENVIDESERPFASDDKTDAEIFIDGGEWIESRSERGGYGVSGMYDSERSMFGVSTAFLLSNIRDVYVTNVKFVNCGGFAIQAGNIVNAVFENIVFDGCFADGVHIMGNSENIYVHNIKGDVGDDIVALNMYDWSNSSINYGPIRNCYVQNVELDEKGKYKAIRILPGIYTFKDGSKTDCSAENIVFENIRGINNFKIYLQTNRYPVDNPEVVGVGSGHDIYFDDIDINLDSPIDAFDNYLNSDPITGTIAAFELGADIDNIVLENIRLKCYRDIYPMSYLFAAGPKSAIVGDAEIYDPYIECHINGVTFKNIKINGETPENIEDYVKTIKFGRIYDSDYCSGFADVKNIKYIWEEDS
mgnify:CR=1 FL=1